MTLTEQILELHRLLDDAELAHAFGGALALAYCTNDPRGTKDIDVNVFIGSDRLNELIGAISPPIDISETNRADLERDGQSRLWWGDTPIDVFLSNHPFHDHAAANRRVVPFAGVADLPVLACADIAVFKCFFARPKDAVDVAAMVTASAIDLVRIEETVEALLGPTERQAFFERVRSDIDQMNRHDE